MSTKSILKNINIKDKKLGYALVSALEKSKENRGKEVKLSRICKEITGDSIKNLFGYTK